MIKHIVGLLYPDTGDLLVHGESVPNMTDDELFEMRKKFGLLFQDGALFGSMNVYDNTAFPLRQHTDKGEDEIGEIVNRACARSASPRRPRRCRTSSPAGCASAPDSPAPWCSTRRSSCSTSPTRASTRCARRCCELIRGSRGERRLLLVISHDLGTARRIADFIAVLWKGRIVESGPSRALQLRERVRLQFLNAQTEGPLAMD